MRLLLRGGIAFWTLLGICLAGDGPQFKEGKWSITTATKIEGMSGGLKATLTQCLSNKNPFPDIKTNGKTCKQTHRIQGNTITFHSSCKDKDEQIELDGKITFAGDSMQGQMKSRQINGGGKATDVIIDIYGKFTGSCKSNTNP
jgi:hypothetical protein